MTVKIRVHGSIIDWLNESLPHIREDHEAADGLLHRLKDAPRRKDTSVRVEVNDAELVLLKTWAAWIIHVTTPKKGNPGPARGLWNAATALARLVDRVREEVSR